MDVVAVLGIALTGLIGLVAALFGSRLTRVSFGELEMQVTRTTADIETAVDRAVAEIDPLTYEQLERGEFRDQQLREIVQSLTKRLVRLEATNERVEVRRQALLETYHKQGLSQSRISFFFSLVLGVLGFGVIVFAIATKSEQVGAYVSGAVTEAVASLFLSQSNQARKLMAQFFDKLRDDRRLEDALRLAHGISDEQLRATLQALMAMQLIGSDVSPSVLPGFRDPLSPGSEGS